MRDEKEIKKEQKEKRRSRRKIRQQRREREGGETRGSLKESLHFRGLRDWEGSTVRRSNGVAVNTIISPFPPPFQDPKIC